VEVKGVYCIRLLRYLGQTGNPARARKRLCNFRTYLGTRFGCNNIENYVEVSIMSFAHCSFCLSVQQKGTIASFGCRPTAFAFCRRQAENPVMRKMRRSLCLWCFRCLSFFILHYAFRSRQARLYLLCYVFLLLTRFLVTLLVMGSGYHQ